MLEVKTTQQHRHYRVQVTQMGSYMFFFLTSKLSDDSNHSSTKQIKLFCTEYFFCQTILPLKNVNNSTDLAQRIVRFCGTLVAHEMER